MERLAKQLEKLQLGIGVVSITVFFFAIVTQVFCRYAKITVSWTGEVSTYAFTWAVFMGAGVMCYENNHFAFNSLVEKLSGRRQEALKITISLVVLIFSLATFYYGLTITKKFWNYRLITLPSVKMGYMWICVPIFGATSCIYSMNHISKSIRKVTGRDLQRVEVSR